MTESETGDREDVHTRGDDRRAFIPFNEAVAKYSVHPRLIDRYIRKGALETRTVTKDGREEVEILESDVAQKLAHKPYATPKAVVMGAGATVALSIVAGVAATEISNQLHVRESESVTVDISLDDQISSLYHSSVQLIGEFEGKTSVDLNAGYGGRQSVAVAGKGLRLSNNIDYVFYPDHFNRQANLGLLSIFAVDVKSDMSKRFARAYARGQVRQEIVDGELAYIAPLRIIYEIWDRSLDYSEDLQLTRLFSSRVRSSVPAITSNPIPNPSSEKLSHGAIRLAEGGALFALPMVFEAMQSTIGDDAQAQVTDLDMIDLSTIDFSVTISDPYEELMELALRNSLAQSSFALFLYSLQRFDPVTP